MQEFSWASNSSTGCQVLHTFMQSFPTSFGAWTSAAFPGLVFLNSLSTTPFALVFSDRPLKLWHCWLKTSLLFHFALAASLWVCLAIGDSVTRKWKSEIRQTPSSLLTSSLGTGHTPTLSLFWIQEWDSPWHLHPLHCSLWLSRRGKWSRTSCGLTGHSSMEWWWKRTCRSFGTGNTCPSS